jgi:hypothetical protein
MRWVPATRLPIASRLTCFEAIAEGNKRVANRFCRLGPTQVDATPAVDRLLVQNILAGIVQAELSD